MRDGEACVLALQVPRQGQSLIDSGFYVSSNSVNGWFRKPETSNEARRSGVIVWGNSELLHPIHQRCAVEAHAHCSAICTSYAPFAFGQYTNDLIMLLLRALPWCAFALERCDRFFDDPCDVVLPFWSRFPYRFDGRSFAKFGKRGGKRFALGQDHGAFDEVLQFADVSRPIPGCQRFHCCYRNRIDALLHLLGKLLHKKADQQRNVVLAVS